LLKDFNFFSESRCAWVLVVVWMRCDGFYLHVGSLIRQLTW